MSIKVRITRKNAPGSRHKTWTTSRTVDTIEHARNLAKVYTKPQYHVIDGKRRNINRTLSVTVYLPDTTAHWTKANGWTLHTKEKQS